MGEEAAPAVRIEVLWRAGCPFCSRLRRGLARAGIATVEHDIWADPEAAARVREVTGGDETVPTVLVGSRALVNPSVAGVVAAVRAEFPDEAEALVGSPATVGTRRLPVGAVGAVWAVGLAVIWVLLSVLQATTTWHLAHDPWLPQPHRRVGRPRRCNGSAGRRSHPAQEPPARHLTILMPHAWKPAPQSAHCFGRLAALILCTSKGTHR